MKDRKKMEEIVRKDLEDSSDEERYRYLISGGFIWTAKPEALFLPGAEEKKDRSAPAPARQTLRVPTKFHTIRKLAQNCKVHRAL